jgi:hypothetical protein
MSLNMVSSPCQSAVNATSVNSSPKSGSVQSHSASSDPASLVFVPETQTQSPSEFIEFSELIYNPDSQELCPETELLQSTAAVPDPDPARQSPLNKPTAKVYRLGKHRLIRGVAPTASAISTAPAIPRDALLQVCNDAQEEHRNVSSIVCTKPPMLPPTQPPHRRGLRSEAVPPNYDESYACYESGNPMPTCSRDDAELLKTNYEQAPTEYSLPRVASFCRPHGIRVQLWLPS